MKKKPFVRGVNRNISAFCVFDPRLDPDKTDVDLQFAAKSVYKSSKI